MDIAKRTSDEITEDQPVGKKLQPDSTDDETAQRPILERRDSSFSWKNLANLIQRVVEHPAYVCLYKILKCNGEDPYCFTSAYCKVIGNTDDSQYKQITISVGSEGKRKDHQIVDKEDPTYKKQCFLSPFLNLFEIDNILRYINSDGKDVPDGWNKSHVEAVKKLFVYLQAGSLKKHSSLLRKEYKETSWTVAVAVHLLQNLSISKSMILDFKMKKKPDKCPCEEISCPYANANSLKEVYANTTIGNSLVWHGNIDVILGEGVSAKLEMNIMGEMKTAEESDLAEPVDDPIKDEFEQCIAETLAFSFCVKRQNDQKKESSVTLIPNLVISKSHVKIFMYDYKNDILMRCSEFPLFNTTETDLQPASIFRLWLALNYRIFCTGVTERILNADYKSNFLEHIEKSVPVNLRSNPNPRKIYENDMCLHCGLAPLKDRLKEHFSIFEVGDLEPVKPVVSLAGVQQMGARASTSSN